jgi:hypothetical protein
MVEDLVLVSKEGQNVTNQFITHDDNNHPVRMLD